MKVHIGKEIRKRIEEIGMTKAEFARRMNRSPQAIQWWLQKDTIDTGLLTKIGEVLNYNFFYIFVEEKELASWKEDPLQYQSDRENSKIAKLSEQLENCKQEKNYLKEINALLKKENK